MKDFSQIRHVFSEIHFTTFFINKFKQKGEKWPSFFFFFFFFFYQQQIHVVVVVSLVFLLSFQQNFQMLSCFSFCFWAVACSLCGVRSFVWNQNLALIFSQRYLDQVIASVEFSFTSLINTLSTHNTFLKKLERKQWKGHFTLSFLLESKDAEMDWNFASWLEKDSIMWK